MPARDPWLTVDDFICRMGLEGDDCPIDATSRKQVAEAIRSASAWVERQTGQRVLNTRYVRRFHGNGSGKFELPFWPIVELISVKVGDADLTPGSVDDGRLDASIVYHDGRSIYRCGDCGFPKGCHNIRVEWFAGYYPDCVPGDVTHATAVLASIFWKERDRAGNKTLNLPGSIEQYIRHLEGADAMTVRRLADWRRLYVDKGIPLPDDECELGLFNLGACGLG